MVQLSVPSLFDVCPTFLQSDNILEIGLSRSDRKVIFEDALSWEIPTRIDGQINSWNDTLVLYDEVFSMTIYRNPKPKLVGDQASNTNTLYSYFSLIKDSSYLRQVFSQGSSLADELWITGKNPPWYSSRPFQEGIENNIRQKFEPVNGLAGVSQAIIQSDYGHGVAYRIVTDCESN